MRKVLEEAPADGLKPKAMAWDDVCAVPEDDALERESGYHLFYYGIHRPTFRWFDMGGDDYDVEILDTWNMTVRFAGRFRGRFRIELPGREYMAVRMRKA